MLLLSLVLIFLFIFLFFFSSRRRHTRWPRDWSSDVCSSDLNRAVTVSTTATIRFWDQGVLLCHYSHERMGSEIRRHMFGPDGSSPSRRTRRIRTANPPHAHATGPRRPEVRAPLPVQR